MAVTEHTIPLTVPSNPNGSRLLAAPATMITNPSLPVPHHALLYDNYVSGTNESTEDPSKEPVQPTAIITRTSMAQPVTVEQGAETEEEIATADRLPHLVNEPTSVDDGFGDRSMTSPDFRNLQTGLREKKLLQSSFSHSYLKTVQTTDTLAGGVLQSQHVVKLNNLHDTHGRRRGTRYTVAAKSSFLSGMAGGLLSYQYFGTTWV